MQDFRRLDVWARAHRLVLTIYGQTRNFPREEVLGITTLLRRTAAAVPMRIAEACGNEAAMMAQELKKAGALTNDLEYVLLLAKDLKFLAAENGEALISEVIEIRKMIFGLARTT
jgi:four helix bundle protein